MAYPFRFDFQQAVQAIAYLLRNEPGHQMNYMRLLKLLYIAERETLAEAGVPLTGSRAVAMERGPVLEEVFALIRGTHQNSAEWSNYFRTENYRLHMTADPGMGRLRRFTAEKLGEVARRHEGDDEWEMVRITHLLPEWIKNDPGCSSTEIPLLDILSAVGRDGDIARILENAQFDARAARFFSEPREPAA